MHFSVVLNQFGLLKTVHFLPVVNCHLEASANSAALRICDAQTEERRKSGIGRVSTFDQDVPSHFIA
jgi:hypothetical protein